MKTMKLLACLTLAAMLAVGCAFLPKTTRQNVYQLPAATAGSHSGPSRAISLRIVRPAATGILRSPRILVMQAPHTLSAFANARWDSPPAILWRDHLLDAFYNDGRIRDLSSDADNLRAQYELRGALRDFHLDLTGAGPTAELSLDARLVDTASQSIVAARRFSVRAPAGDSSAAEAVTAFGQAADQLAQALIDWVLSQVDTSTAPTPPNAIRKDG